MLSRLLPTSAPAPGAPRASRVMVVDDTEAQRYAVSKAMHLEGFEVHEASSGAEALAIASRVVLDAVVLDVHLPDMDGYEVCRRLKADASRVLPVLHLSATSTSDAARARGLAAGADGYLTHPFNASDLRAWVSALVRMKREMEQRVADASLNCLLRNALDSLGDHIALLGPTGDVLAVNRAWATFAIENEYGEAGAGLGTNYCDVCDRATGEGAGDARAIAHGVRRLLDGELYEFEYDYACHSPTEERWFRMIARRMEDPGPVAVIVAHANQTRAQLASRAEADAHSKMETAYLAHHETEARFRRFVESAHEGVLATDLEGNITYANSRTCELIECPQANLVGTSIFALVRDGVDFRTLYVSLRRGRAVALEVQLAGVAGGRVDVLASLSPILDPKGAMIGALVMLADQRLQKEAERKLTDALRVAELDRRRLEATLEALPVGVWLSEADGRLTHTNPAADRIWRGKVPKVAGTAEYGVYRALWPDTGLPIEAEDWHLARSLRSGETFTGEMVEIERFDGTHAWTLNSSAPIFDDAGRIIGGVVAQLDVTERELAAKERETLVATLRAERGHLSEIFDNAPAFLAVLRGPEFVFERFNLKYQELVGHRAVLGASLLSVIPELATQGALDRLHSVRESGIPIVMHEARGELRRIPDAPPEARYLDVVFQRLFAADGNHAIVVHGIDVTERVQAVADILETKARLRDQFAKLPVPTYLWETHCDTDFVLLDFNEAALETDPRLASSKGRTGRDIFPQSDDVRADMHRSLRENRVLRRTAEVPDERGNGQRYLELTIGPQQPDRVLVHAVDTTERLALETQLRQSLKMEAVGQLAGGVAHDFNNLLTVIGAHSSFLLESLDSGDPQHEDAEAIHLATLRAAGLTRQLLAFSRKQILRPSVLDLNANVKETQGMLARLLGEDIDMVIELAADLPHVIADAGQLGQVLVNLAVNARDAMPSGGRLTVATRVETLPAARGMIAAGRYVVLSVRDTGTGMAATVQSRLFEPFFTTKGVGQGTGLGLATVYGIVKQSGGFITVESAPGVGSTFVVHLPAVEQHEEAEQIEEATRAAARGVETVLLVEDEAGVRAVAKRVLLRQGYVVLEAADGQAALQISSVYDAKIDLLLTDAVMPGLVGAEVIERIRADRPGIRALMMSGYTDNEIVRRGIVSSKIPFIEKPFDGASLAKAVRLALDEE